jgi:hypothetical protein
MTEKDIVRLAEEAELWLHTDRKYEAVEKFAKLVAAEEREACAKVCDAECNPTPNEGNITTYQSGGYITAEYLAAAIRARGQE